MLGAATLRIQCKHSAWALSVPLVARGARSVGLKSLSLTTVVKVETQGSWLRTQRSWVQQLEAIRAEVALRLSHLLEKVEALGVIGPRRLVPVMIRDQETEMRWVPGGR